MSEPIHPLPEAQPHTCGTCRYWGGRAIHWNTPQLRTCASPYILYGYRVAQAREHTDAAAVEMHEGWALLTGPAFGCIHWTAGEQWQWPGELTTLPYAMPEIPGTSPAPEDDHGSSS